MFLAPEVAYDWYHESHGGFLFKGGLFPTFKLCVARNGTMKSESSRNKSGYCSLIKWALTGPLGVDSHKPIKYAQLVGERDVCQSFGENVCQLCFGNIASGIMMSLLCNLSFRSDNSSQYIRCAREIIDYSQERSLHDRRNALGIEIDTRIFSSSRID